MKKYFIGIIVFTALLGLLTLLVPVTSVGLNVNIPQGASIKMVSKNIAKNNLVPSWLLETTGRLSTLMMPIVGQKIVLKPGRYTLEHSQTAWSIWRTLNQQLPQMVEVRLLEGWNFKQIRAAINQHTDLKHETIYLDDAALMQRLGVPELHPEGRFFPDTYQVSRGASDITVYKVAFERMRKMSSTVWSTKPADSVLKSVDDLINLAAIVEKETAAALERGLVASVFHNRLNLGMRLQTDPTVIYGMGAYYQGNIRKADLQRDTPYNTYTRLGLPPTPIAAPSEASLRAAINPPKTNFIYFVAKGDGSGRSQFSSTLNQHNRAVADYLSRLKSFK
ncbi:MAG: hypothetical protein RL344_1342 [Pseudomonadota bacterium]|jgi:UPF0755 protein